MTDLKTVLIGVAILMSFGPVQAFAQSADYSPDDFVKAILSGPRPCPPGKTAQQCEANPKTRRFSIAPIMRTDSGGSAEKPVERKVTPGDILVTFATGSADLTEKSKANLKSVAEGLNSGPLAPLNFEVAGFTDAAGSAEVNAQLSKERADVVKAYLATLKIAPERLTAVGYGSDHLADPTNPTAEQNRRVELHRLN